MGFFSKWTVADVLRRNEAVASPARAVAVPARGAERESELHEQILAECRRRQWIALHGRMDIASARTVGEPDFVILADDGRVLLVEAKSRTGKLRPEQAALHAWARRLGHSVAVVRSIEEFLNLASDRAMVCREIRQQ